MSFHLLITLDRQSVSSLSSQLYEELRRLIVSAVIAPDSHLPPSRALAEDLAIARATVVKAYTRLRDEGYVSSHDGSATLVNSNLPSGLSAEISDATRLMRLQARRSKLSAYARRFVDASNQEPTDIEPEIAFYGFRGDLEQAPIVTISQSMAYVARGGERAIASQPASPGGLMALRRALAAWLSTARGIKCQAEQILLFGNEQQALSLIARLHIERGDLVALEDPCCPLLRSILQNEGAALMPIKVDQNGMVIEQLPQPMQERFSLICLTPSHQYPTGSALSLSRRLALLSWAQQNGAFIVEDDQGSALRYRSPAVPALKAIDQQDQVIFLGAFNKTMFPSLSMAYLVLPVDLVDIYSRSCAVSGFNPPLLLQETLADFMRRGLLTRHLRKMRALYKARRLFLTECLQNKFGSRATISGEESGLYLLVRFDTYLPEEDLIKKAYAAGVGLLGTRGLYQTEPPESPEFMLGFADLSESKIEEGLRRLAEIIL